MAKCTFCNIDARQNKDVCYWHDPEVSDAEKLAARRKGGTNSRRVPLNLDVDSLLPIRTPEDLNRFYNALLQCCAEEYQDDLSGFVRAAVRLTPKLAELIAFQSLAALEDRLAGLESRRNGKLLPSRIVNNVDTDKYPTED